MNIIEVLIPLFVFIILYPIFKEVYRMFSYNSLTEGFKIGKVLISVAKKKGVEIPDSDVNWLESNINDKSKNGKMYAIAKGEGKDIIKRKRTLLSKLSDEQLLSKTSVPRLELIYYKEHTVESVKQLVGKKTTTQTEKEMIEDNTRSELLAERNTQQLGSLKKDFDSYGERNETRFANLEETVSKNTEKGNNLEDLKIFQDKTNKKLKRNRNDMIELRNEVELKPTSDYVNSRVAKIEDKLQELETSYRNLRTDSSMGNY